MTGVSVGRSLTRPCSGKKTLRRCRNNAATDNVVFIDDDGDDAENAIVLDSPELFLKNLRGSSVRQDKQRLQRVIICIDDEESTDNKHPGIGGKKRCNFSSGTSLSKGFSAAAGNHDKFQNEASDDVEFVQENISSPVKISKCKRTYSGKASSRNRYGLGPESENGFSNDEVEEDSSGSVREQWEKAFSKRKYESCRGQTGGVGCSKRSKASHHANYSGEEVVSAKTKEPPAVSSAEEMSCETEGLRSSTAAGNVPQGSTFTSKRKSSADLSKSILNEHAPYSEDNFDSGPDFQAKNASMDRGEEYDPNLKYDGCNLPNAEPEWPFFSPRHFAKEVHPAAESSQVRYKSETTKEASSGSPVEHREQASCNRKSENSNDQSGNKDYIVYPDDRNNDTEGSAAEQLKKSSSFSIPGKGNYKRKFSSPLSSIGNLPREPFLKRRNFGSHTFKSVLKRRCPSNKTSTHSTIDPLVEEPKMNSTERQDTLLSDHYFQACTNKVGSVHSTIFSHSTCDIITPAPNVDAYPVNEACSSSCVNEVVVLHEKSGSLVGSAENCMISEREKLKDTDEYKQAMEVEWASRRQVLQAQAEEAKQLRRLRKREIAERMRLLNMERRQKQRVEEIRETNKKDEEQMNMKDLIRAEVRNELSKVEISCSDMASVLRSLGIQVGSEPRPNADEVRVACKRALFAFHPDRASKSDTRQQVEAEEKFKLITRMKEKFSVA